MPQAYNGMGFSNRKLGDYAKALENYDRALQLAPNFPDAIEYRGEAYLALNRLDDAKQSYLTLFAMDRKQADSLMAAMKDYVAKKKADPAGVDAAALSAFETLDHRARHRRPGDEADGVQRASRILEIDRGSRITGRGSRGSHGLRDADHADKLNRSLHGSRSDGPHLILGAGIVCVVGGAAICGCSCPGLLPCAGPGAPLTTGGSLYLEPATGIARPESAC